MDETTFRKALCEFPLGDVRYHETINSTNDKALAWAAGGAPDLALVYAEEQTLGRGRGSRRWFTPPGTALAFSLVLHPLTGEGRSVARYSGLGAVAVCAALETMGLHPQIKWPNDILLRQRKVCGILVEATWLGDRLENIVVGIGVNITPKAVPASELVDYPAGSVEGELKQPVDRLGLLVEILRALLYWRSRMFTDEFVTAWGNRLAFRGERVSVQTKEGKAKVGKVAGLEEDGSLVLQADDGQEVSVQFGEVHLRRVL
jgi:BirA family biotin operon repressor/biotin-[acetyl-CoA-carboxylase] ligase